MNYTHLDPALTEGTESLWPMGIAAAMLWLTWWFMTHKGER